MHLHLKKYVLLMSFFGAVLPLVAQTDTLCQSDPVGNYHVIGQANSTYFWDTQGDGVLLSGQGNDSVQINWNNGPGTYQLTVLETNSLGCVGLPVVLNILILDPSVSINGPPECTSDLLSYSFSVTVNAASFVASAGTATNTSGNLWLIDGVPSGTDVILTVSTGSCSVNLTVNAPDCNCPPISPPTATNVSYCLGDAIPGLTASPPAGFEVDWYSVSSGGTAILSNSNSYSPGIPGTWWVESRDPSTGCVSSQRTEVSLIENAPPLVTASPGTEICAGTSVLLTVSGAATYSWSPPGGLSAVSGNSVNANPSIATTYTVVGTDVNGCSASATVDIDVNPIYSSSVSASICSGSSYTLPDGSSVNAVGSYPVTLTSISGCDSVVTTNLTVVNELESFVDVSICSGSSYILPDGSTVSASGSYPVTLIASTGCDSVVTTNLTVVNQLATTIDISICIGSSYTLPDGSSVSSAGSYPVILTSTTGCDSVVTTELTIQSTLSSSVTATICAGESYNFNGQILTNAGIYQAELTASSGCDSLINLTLVVLQPFETSLSAMICQGSSYTFGGNDYTLAGIYRDTLQSANGCDSILVLNLGIYPEISVEVNASICDGSSYILPNGDSAIVAGVYPVTLSSSLGCDSLVTVNLTVDPVIEVTLSEDVEICQGTSTTLTASGAAFYLWEPALGLSDSTGSSVVASPTATTSYIVYGNSGMCSDVDTVTVAVLPVPQLQIDPSAGAICLGDTLSLEASGADLLIWNDTSGVSLSCDTCVTALAYPQESMTYILTGILGQCSSTTSVTVEVAPAVNAAISGDTTLCLGESVQLTASGGSLYNWSTGDSLAVVNVSVPASTFVTVEVSNGVCTDTATTALLVYPLPLVNAGEDTLIHYGSSAQILANSNATGTWFPVNDLSCTDCLEPIADPSSTTTYCLTVVNSFGCAATDCIDITVDTLCADLFIPNVFAPDEGGHTENNCFKLYGADCIGSMTLTIYNRWGEKVFVSSNPDECWDGNFRGKPLNTGVYVYYLEAELITGESLSKQGNLTLMR